MEKNLELATFGAGCFWCVEAVFQRLQGVEKVVSGYTGGSIKNPTYREVCSGLTGHAEVIQISFDPTVISFKELLELLWVSHDPTTLNRQGADRGTQYRSAIYYHNEEQKKEAENSKRNIASALWKDPIVTEVSPAQVFYPAEEGHQDYYNSNSIDPYCRVVINPKITNLKNKFAHKLKPEYV